MTLAWYAAYGSNTDRERFLEYLDGCREPARPLDDRPFLIDLPLYFAGPGRAEGRWGLGGVAFAGPARDPQPVTRARAWLLPVERIAEVGAQENRLGLDAASLDLAAGDHIAFPGRAYDTWIRCGEIDGLPVVTLTSSRAQPRNPPGPAYVAVVAAGLRATHEMTREDVAHYLEPRAGLPFATLMAWQSEGHG